MTNSNTHGMSSLLRTYVCVCLLNMHQFLFRHMPLFLVPLYGGFCLYRQKAGYVAVVTTTRFNFLMTFTEGGDCPESVKSRGKNYQTVRSALGLHTQLQPQLV